MNFMNKLERKFGKYAIPNITWYMILCYAAGYVLQFVGQAQQVDILSYLTLNPYAICHGEVWRIVTWIIVPPDSLDLLTLISLYFYYSIGRSLEIVWGTFRYNVFLLSGMVFTIVGAFLLYGYYGLIQPDAVVEMMGGGLFNAYSSTAMATWFYYLSSLFTTYNICMSLFLAYAITFPNNQVYLMMILPIKVKVLGIVYAILIVIPCLYTFGTPLFVPQVVAVLASFLNVIVFFIVTRNGFRTPKQIKRQVTYKRQINKVASLTKHRCAICGRTEVDSPDMTFRFCSKCDGNYEYCEEHLYTHKHVEAPEK